jgi:hypothetical protein
MVEVLILIVGQFSFIICTATLNFPAWGWNLPTHKLQALDFLVT